MQKDHKLLITNVLAKRSTKTSQNQLALQADVSPATISQMLNNNWTLISDAMWRKVQVTLRIDPKWNTANTQNFLKIQQLLNAVKSRSLSIGISDSAGKGKTAAFTAFERDNDNVIYVECKNYWSKKSYIKQILINAGLSSIGTTEELINRLIKYLKGLETPIMIIDQFDKLKDPQLDLFMDFNNDLSGHCAFVLSGVEALEKRIVKGVNREKIGYAELYSRIGKKFIKLDPITQEDVQEVCVANGINDADDISFIYHNSEGDLRRVRRDIDKIKLKANNKKTA